MGALRTSGSTRALFKFRATVEKSDNRLWGSHINVPSEIARTLKNGPSRRVLCSINASKKFQRALVPYRANRYVVTLNKALLKQLQITLGTSVQVTLERDPSRYGLPMPEELSVALSQDPEGSRLFHQLPPGKRRTLLYIVDHVKDPQRRAWRAAVVLRHLTEHQGKIFYKELHRSIRGFRAGGISTHHVR